MTNGMRMMMLSRTRDERSGERQSGSRTEYGGSEGNYSGMNNRSNYSRTEYENEMGDMENRFRGGSRYYDNRDVRQMDHRMDGNEDVENRRRFPRRRDGTFAPRNEYGGGEMHHGYPYVPPVYEGGEREVNPIGFVPNGYTTYATHQQGNEMEHRRSQMERGGASGHTTKLTRDMADEWMEGLQNEDGSKGPHWSMEQTKQVMAQRGIKGDPIEFYAVINALYSDYCKIFQRHNVNKVDLYADLANAWINDKDAVDGKAAIYFECIAQK